MGFVEVKFNPPDHLPIITPEAEKLLQESNCYQCKYWYDAVSRNCVDPYGEYYCPYDQVECDEHNSKFELYSGRRIC